jgi:hypothetical protein
MVIEELKKLPEDFCLVANMHITLPTEVNRKVFYITSPKDLLDIEKAVVVIDDAGIWFGSRQWDKLDPRIQDKVINNRKDGLRIWVTTQFFDSIDKYIRMNCHEYWEANKVIGSDEYAQANKVWGLFTVRRYHPHLHDKIRRKPIQRRYFRLLPRYVQLYDTFEKVTAIRPITTHKQIIEQQKEIEKAKTLDTRRSRGRPRKIKLTKV